MWIFGSVQSLFHADWAQFNKDMTEHVYLLTTGSSWSDINCSRGHRRTSARIIWCYNLVFGVDQSNVNGDVLETLILDRKHHKPWCSKLQKIYISWFLPRRMILLPTAFVTHQICLIFSDIKIHTMNPRRKDTSQLDDLKPWHEAGLQSKNMKTEWQTESLFVSI